MVHERNHPRSAERIRNQATHSRQDQKMKHRRRRTTTQPNAQFSCLQESDEKYLQMTWAKNHMEAGLDYIEMAWNNSWKGSCPSNCTIRFDYQPMSTKILDDIYRQETEKVCQMTDTLANVFRLENDQTVGGEDSTTAVKEELILAVVRGLLSSDVNITGATVALFNNEDSTMADATLPTHPVILGVYRTLDSAGEQMLRVENLTKSESYETVRQATDDWLWDVINKVGNEKSLDSSLCQQPASLQDMVVEQKIGLVSRSYAVWGYPVFNCYTLRTWMLHYAMPLFACTSQKLTLRGVLKVDFDLATVDIDQCNDTGIFGGTHRCPNNSKCEPLRAKGFHRGNYVCKCLPGYYVSNGSLVTGAFTETGSGYSTGKQPAVDQEIIEYEAIIAGFECLPCKASRESTSCLLQYDILIRGIPMGIESLCITIGIALTVAIIRLRKTKVMKASFWCLLEVITFGSLLLHATVIIQYFEPTDLSCLFIPWLREVGFAIVYGALILKVYRVLAEFQSRKAHRVQVRDKDLFKYLCCIVVVVIGYMAAWTAVTIDQGNGRRTLLQNRYTREHLMYAMCQSTWWDYVVEVGEFLFMAFSMYICYRTRSAPSSYGEVRFITLAIYNETVISAAFYVTRHFLLFDIHPDYIFLMYFIRCQLTVSITMILILGPKIWYSHKPPEESSNRSRAFSSCDAQEGITSPAEVVKLNTTLNPNGDVEVGEINLADMNPEDIRAELKRLYTQLQIYKTKTMRQDNPHISKRRGGRKQTHRRFSLQAFHSKHRHHQCSEHGEHGGGAGGGVIGGETEVSRTPEESTNSAEGVSIYMDESSVAETTRAPTVTFKSSGNKSK